MYLCRSVATHGGRVQQRKTNRTEVEERKTKRADLENRRLTWFLMGVVLALSIAYAALEYTDSPGGGKADADMLDDIDPDLDLLPKPKKNDMLMAAQPLPGKPKTEKLDIVEATAEQLKKLNAITEKRTVGSDDENYDDSADEKGKPTDPDAPATIPPVAVDEDDNPLNFRIVEQLPEYPGGMAALVQWLTKNLVYPQEARKHNIQGRVVVSFIINTDGSLSDIHLTTTAHFLLDREALRVAKLMPKWKPGIADNKPCRTLFAIPIEFKI